MWILTTTATAEALDMAEILSRAAEIGACVNESREVAEYLYWKKKLQEDADVRDAVARFQSAKNRWEEVRRFGRFHPDFREALNEVAEARKRLDRFEVVRRFKAAEAEVDRLLYEIAVILARSVSDTIKVPSNDPLPVFGGCGGGCCGKCG